MRKTLALILALVLALSCMGFAVAEPVAEQVEEAVAEIEEVAIGAAAEEVVAEEAEPEEVIDEAAYAQYTKVDDSALDNPSEDGSAKGHEYYEEFTTTVTATCTQKGGTYYICQIPGCGHTALKAGTGAFLGGAENPNGMHVAAAGATTVHYNATCMNPEYDLISKCKFCGATNVQNYKDASGNAYAPQKIHFDPAATVLVEVIKEPTCTEEGLGKYLCQNCPHDADASRKYKEMAIPKAEHQWEVWGKKDGTTEQPVEEFPSDKFVRTCVEGGWEIIEGTQVRYCKVCYTVHPEDKANVKTTAPANHAAYMDDYFDYLEKGEEDKIIDKKLVNAYTAADKGKWVYDSTTDKLALDEAEKYYYFNGNIFVENADIAAIEAVQGVAKEIKDGKTIYHLPTDTTRASTHLGPVDIEIVAPTCETAGSVTMTCTLCKATVSGIIPALGHKWMNESDNSTVEPLNPNGEYDCTEMGIQTHMQCAECGKEVNSGYFTKHEFSKPRIVYMQQQEGDTGLAEYAEADLKPCLDYEIWTYCGNQVGVDSKGNPVYCTVHQTKKVAHTKEHSYKDSENLVPTATCTEDGEEYFYCQYCYKMIAKPVKALGHVAKKFDDKGKSLAHIITAATCTEDGLRGYPCARCGLADAVTEKIPALGHRYEEVYDPAVTVRFEVKDDNGHIVKDELGNIVYTYYDCSKKGVIAYKCSRCGGATKEEVGPQHQWYTYEELKAANYDVEKAQETAIARIKADAEAKKDNTYKEPTCTADGWITAQCHRCGNMVNAFKLNKLGHDRARAKYDHDAECKAGNASMNDILFNGVYYTGYVPATCTTPAFYWYSCKDPKCPAAAAAVITYDGNGKHWVKEDGTLSDTEVKIPHLVKVNDGAKDASAHVSIFSQDVVTDLDYTKYKEKTDTGFVITKMPTCEETGTALYICDLCKAQTSMTLPKLPHNNVLTWNATTRKYEKSCKKVPVADLQKYITDSLSKVYTNKALLDEVSDRLTKLSEGKTYVPGIGGHAAEQYEVVKLTYGVKINDDAKTVNVVKKSDTNDGRWPVLYVSWQYTLPDGSNFSYVKTFDTNTLYEYDITDDWDYYGKLGYGQGLKGVDVRIGNPQPSADWKLDTIVAIVCDDLELETKSQNEANHLDLGHDVKQF